jgi:hypothetical protein
LMPIPWIFILVGFILPSWVLVLKAQTLHEGLDGIAIFAIGIFLVYIRLHRDDAQIKKWLDRF